MKRTAKVHITNPKNDKVMKTEVRMSIAEKKNINEMVQLKKQAKEREKMKREAKLPLTIRTKSGRMAEKYEEFLSKNKVAHITELDGGCHVIRIMGLTSSEANKLMREMARHLRLSKNKAETKAAYPPLTTPADMAFHSL